MTKLTTLRFKTSKCKITINSPKLEKIPKFVYVYYVLIYIFSKNGQS